MRYNVEHDDDNDDDDDDVGIGGTEKRRVTFVQSAQILELLDITFVALNLKMSAFLEHVPPSLLNKSNFF